MQENDPPPPEEVKADAATAAYAAPDEFQEVLESGELIGNVPLRPVTRQDQEAVAPLDDDHHVDGTSDISERSRSKAGPTGPQTL